MIITAVNPPFLPDYSRGQRSPAVTRSGTLYYPIWLSYAAGALEREGHDVQLLDAPAGGLDFQDTRDRIEARAPGLVVIETSTPSIESDAAFADSLAGSGATVVLAGTHPSALPEATMRLGERFHGLVVGEYELPLIGLAGALEEGSDPSGVAGLCLRMPDGGLKFTGEGERVEDLDSLPWVSRVYARHLDVTRYNNPNALHPQVMIMGGRGCPHGCTFCVFPQTLQGRRFRRRSVADITGEVLWVQENMPEVRAVFFEDDTISADRERLRKLAGSFIENGFQLSWTCNMRADVDLETLRICAESGLRTVCVGFESGSDRMLANMRKGITTDRSSEFMENARKAGILVHGCFMVGTAGETGETMRETLEFALELDPDTAQFYPMMVYPGTEAYRQAEESGNLMANSWREWLSPEGLHSCVIRTDSLTSEELVDFCDTARRKFYLRPGYILRKLWRSLLDPDERRRTLKAFSTFRRYLFRSSRRD
ncbi:MAG: radical SAM protein [Candidatus Aegiribacteria sp.]